MSVFNDNLQQRKNNNNFIGGTAKGTMAGLWPNKHTKNAT